MLLDEREQLGGLDGAVPMNRPPTLDEGAPLLRFLVDVSVELGAVLEEAGNGSGVQDAADYTAPRLERAERAPLPTGAAIGEPASDQNEQRPEQPTAVLDNPGAKRIVLEAGALPWAVDLGIEPNPDGASDELAAEVEVVASGDPEAVVGDGDRLRLAEQAVRPVPGGEGGGQDTGLQRVGDVVEENDRSTAEEDGSDLLTELLIPAGEGPWRPAKSR